MTLFSGPYNDIPFAQVECAMALLSEGDIVQSKKKAAPRVNCTPSSRQYKK
jgi:hypothetical protein